MRVKEIAQDGVVDRLWLSHSAAVKHKSTSPHIQNVRRPLPVQSTTVKHVLFVVQCTCFSRVASSGACDEASMCSCTVN